MDLLDSKQIANKSITTKKIFFYKNLIRYIDIFVSILIIIGCIMSQVEDEFYYTANFQDRVGVVKLMRFISKNGVPNDKTDLLRFNISYLNSTNLNEFNFEDYMNLPLELPIPEVNATIRYILTVLTIFCMPCIVLGRYIEFLREEIYKRNLESKYMN
jgi:hypothetical protein